MLLPPLSKLVLNPCSDIDLVEATSTGMVESLTLDNQTSPRGWCTPTLLWNLSCPNDGGHLRNPDFAGKINTGKVGYENRNP